MSHRTPALRSSSARSTRRPIFENLEDRRMLALTWLTHADFRGTRDSVSEPRSLRSIVLSTDDSSIYASFIQGSTSAEVRKLDAAAPIPGVILNNSAAIEGRAQIIDQSKGLATDDRGYIYLNRNDFNNSTAIEFQIYNSDLTTLIGSRTSTGVSSQLSGMSVHREGDNYYLYIGRQSGAATIERWDVTNPADITLDTDWGSGGRANLATLTGSLSAFVNGLEVDTDGIVYAAGGVLATGRGDSIFKLSADGTALLDTQTVNGAMDVALFGGKVYVSQYLANASAISVHEASDLDFIETLTTGFVHPNVDTDTGYSGIDINSEGQIFVADQIYDLQAPNRTHFDRILVSLELDLDGPITSNVVVTPNQAEFGSSDPIAVTATIDDSTTNSFFITGAEYSLDGGTIWLPMEAVDGAFDEVSEDVTATFTQADLAPTMPGTFTVLVRGTDSAGNTGDSASASLLLEDTTLPIGGALALNPSTVETNYTGPIALNWSGTDNYLLESAEYSLNGGTTWLPLPATDGATDEASEAFDTTFTLADANITAAGTYTILARLTDAEGNLSAESSTTLTVVAPPTISIDDVSLAEGNSGTTAFEFTISLSASSLSTVTVDYSTALGTAQVGDFTGVPTTSVEFMPGETEKVITVLVNGDTVTEPDETFLVNLASAVGGTIVDPEGVGTIENDDVNPSVVLSTNGVLLTESGGSIIVSANLSSPAVQPVTVNLAFTGNATFGSDYAASATSIVIPAGQSSGSITLTGLMDIVIDPNELLSVSIDTVSNANVGSPFQVTALILESTAAGGSVVVDPYTGGTSLFIRGTGGSDVITVLPTFTQPNTYRVIVNGRIRGPFTLSAPGIGRIYVQGLAGNDVIDVGLQTRHDAYISAGAGFDVVNGGEGNDVLLGERGTDTLTGRGGRDLMIGGLGHDVLSGGYQTTFPNSDENILIGNRTVYDTNFDALNAIMAVWTSNDSFANRTQRLATGVGTPLGVKLDSSTVLNDAALDTLIRGLGSNWFLDYETSFLRKDIMVRVPGLDRLN